MRVRLLFTFLGFLLPLFADEELADILPAAIEIPIIREDVAMNDPFDLIAASPAPKKTAVPTDGYTINYNTVSIVEYIRFASKICKVNFIYDEADLNFTVTVVSDEPVTPQNVMATLIQVLRIHGLLLIEQDNNLVIHKSPDVKQIATLVTESGQEENAPIVTRIFRVKNAKPESLAAIIRPMISTSAMIEVSSETRQLILTDITANVDKVAALIENLDSPHTLLDIQSFATKHNKPEFLIELASQIMMPIAQGNPFILVPQNLANEIFIVSTPELVDKAIAVFTSLDSVPKVELSPKKLSSQNTFVYKAVSRPSREIKSGLDEIGDNLQRTGGDPELIQTIDSAKLIPESNSIMFIGSNDAIGKIKEFLTALDVAGGTSEFAEKTSFFVYKPQYRSAEEIQRSILEMAANLKGTKGASPALIDTIQSVKVNPSTHTLSFSGAESTFPRIQELLATIDASAGRLATAPTNTQFYIYKPVYQTGEQVSAALKEVASQLKAENLADPGFLNALDSMKWVKSTNSLLFTGDPVSLQKVQTLIGTIDVTGSKKGEKNYFQYRPKHASQAKTESYLKEIARNLAKKGGSKSLIDTIRSYKWIPESQTFMFYGPEGDLTQIQDLLGTFDTPESGTTKAGYYIYKVQNTTGDVIEDELDHLAKNFKSSGLTDANILDVIAKMRYVKETNSLLLSGDPKAVDEVKQLIAQYDYPRAQGPTSSNFFMYKPQNVSAVQVEKSLKEVGVNLKNAGLADPSLLKTIESAKYVETTNSLIFTGPPDALTKIQTLIKEIDIPPAVHAPIQHVGKTTFLLYKLKNAGGPQIVASLRNMASDLKKSGADKELYSALNSVKYIKETNSLFFTGTEDSLGKVQSLIERFDVTGLAAKPVAAPSVGSSNFFVYKPQSLSGPDIERLMNSFAEHLKSSGLSDQDLFNAINSMRFTEDTGTLVFTGTPAALDKVKELLKEFDIPSNLPSGGPISSAGPSIQAIDNTSFLVYKLQFHKGDEIQGALRQIAKDLILSNAPVNQGLLNSINSIQWLEVTNSLLCSGDQETLTRLRELIKNLDIPLKQVFIEMLVVQTTLTNALNFGLEWGANYKYRNRFGSAGYNSQPIRSNGNPSTFMQNLSKLNPATSDDPTPIGNIPVSSGFDLGVIGEVIRHNGETFLTLGSLLSALQTDDETSVIMTPKIITQDGRTSTIFVGENIPFVGSFIQNNGANVVNTSNLEYRDIGFNLTVTPVLGNSDIVTLDINLDRSQTTTDVTGSAIDFNTQSAQGIITSKTTMQTTVHVPDNNFLILSGMVNNSNAKSKAGIPCLGGLPLIGAAFSKNADTYVNSNIVIFIRPHIINSAEDMRALTTKEEEYFRDQAGTPYLERHFDEGMEMIKTVDDE